MKNKILKTLLALVVMLAAAGNVFAGQVNVESGETYKIKNFYDAKQEAFDKVATEVKYIKSNNKILGEYLYELTAGDVVAIEGGFEATLTYNNGRIYTIREFYEPKAKAYDSLMTELNIIKSLGKINGVDVDSVSAIVEKEGRFSALVTDDEGKEYIVSEYFSPKAEAYSNLLARVKAFKNSGTINGVDVDSVSDIVERDGALEAVVTDDDGKEYTISEYFSAKAEAYHNLMARVKDLKNLGIINGVDVDSVGDIVESEGKLEAVVTDDDGKEYALSEYFSDKAEAYHSLLVQVTALRNVGSKINGVAVDSVSEIVERTGKFEAVVTDDDGNKIVMVSFFDPNTAEKGSLVSLL